MATSKTAWVYRDFYLSPKQATLLRRLKKMGNHGIDLEELQGYLQTTAGACGRRGMLVVATGRAYLSELGARSLDEYEHAHIERSESTIGKPFARALSALVGATYTAKNGKVVSMKRRHAA